MKLWKRIRKYRNISAFAISMVTGFVWMFAILLFTSVRGLNYFGNSFAVLLEYVGVYLLMGGITGLFVIYPFMLTGLNIRSLFHQADPEMRKSERRTEWITIILGVLYSLIYEPFTDICFRTDWDAAIYYGYYHTPIWTEAAWTVIVLACVGIAGYLLLSVRNINFIPPLITVCGIASVYLGMLLCVLWIIQVFPNAMWLCLFPFNCIVIGIRTVQVAVREWQGDKEKQDRSYRNCFLNRINHMLMDSSKWPLAAFFIMLPLLGILIAVLALFGQQPDSIIRAWTETSDWTLSQKIAPEGVFYDEHYLCTVAAQGHARVVKPLRMGNRHGHEVTVNRQLCIANAFEQLLEERVLWLHRPVRRFYDTYGFPVARLIHSKYTADLIYLMMKPLEWIFLAVLYLVDEKPENRIAVQYPHTPIPVKDAITS